MFQRLELIGRLGKDPEMRFTPSGQAVTNFSLATTRKWTGNDGQPKDETTWFNISAWGKLGELCNQYTKKGSLVRVSGRLSAQIKPYQTASGETKASYEVLIDEILFLGNSDNRSQQDNAPYQAPQSQQKPAYQKPVYNPPIAPSPVPLPNYSNVLDSLDEDEIPF